MLLEFREALYSYLSTYAGLVSLISTKIYPLTIPQTTSPPAIAYERIYSERHHCMQADSTLTRHTIQFTIVSTTLASCESISEQLRTALQNYKGTMGGTGGVVVRAVLIGNEHDFYDEESDLYNKYVEYEFMYEE